MSCCNSHASQRFGFTALLLASSLAGALSAHAQGPSSAQASAESQASADAQANAAAFTIEARVDLNTASAQELDTLPGIGPSKAAAIIARREQRPFRRIEEIMRVRGIGRATFRELRDRIRVSPRE